MPKIKTTFAEPPEDGRWGMPFDTPQTVRSEPDPNHPTMFTGKNYTMPSIHTRNRAQKQDAYMRYSEDYYNKGMNQGIPNGGQLSMPGANPTKKKEQTDSYE